MSPTKTHLCSQRRQIYTKNTKQKPQSEYFAVPCSIHTHIHRYVHAYILHIKTTTKRQHIFELASRRFPPTPWLVCCSPLMPRILSLVFLFTILCFKFRALPNPLIYATSYYMCNKLRACRLQYNGALVRIYLWLTVGDAKQNKKEFHTFISNDAERFLYCC